MHLVLITPPAPVPREHAVLHALFERGLPTLHLRKPGAAAAELRAYLQELPPQYLGRVVIHEHHSLAEELGLRGIHYRERDREQAGHALRRPPGGRTLSTSVHAPQQLEGCGPFDYVFLSPIFDSMSKAGYGAAFPDRAALASHLARSPCPVYALGGVTADNLPEVQRLGFMGAALLGSVWQAPDPVAAFEAVAGVCEALGQEERTP